MYIFWGIIFRDFDGIVKERWECDVQQRSLAGLYSEMLQFMLGTLTPKPGGAPIYL